MRSASSSIIIIVKERFSCISRNVVYIIYCKRCALLYVGETKRRLGDRVAEHLRSIGKNTHGLPVAAHFNPPSLFNIGDFSVTAVISCRGSDHQRLSLENGLIFRMGTRTPHGINLRLNLIWNPPASLGHSFPWFLAVSMSWPEGGFARSDWSGRASTRFRLYYHHLFFHAHHDARIILHRARCVGLLLCLLIVTVNIDA